MNIRDINKKYGRHTLVVAVILIWAGIIWSFFANGYVETWYKWHFPARMPPFADFRLIPYSAEAFRSGVDPTTNPGHIFNYPKIWYIFFYTGITQDDTIWIVVTLLLLLFAVVFVFPEKLTVVDSLLMLPLIFSPAAMLLYERGNVDIVFFILCGFAILQVCNTPLWAVFTLSVAAIFKMFPFFGIGIFLRENKRNFYKYVLISMLVFGIYVGLSYKDLSVIWNLTQRGTFLSYGDYIIFILYKAYFRYYLLKLSLTEEQIVSFMKILPHLFALTVLVFAFWLGTRSKILPSIASERNLTAFRMGAFIYIGTFLLGNNWDYRLTFLIFTIPQISHWLFSPGGQARIIAWSVFVAMLASVWYTFLLTYFVQITEHAYELQFFTFDEVMNWSVFAGLAYLVAWSAPRWVRSYSWNPLLQE
jgi:hypothetical protein